MQQFMRWSVVLALTVTIAGASAPPLLNPSNAAPSSLTASLVNPDAKDIPPFDPLSFTPTPQRLTALEDRLRQSTDTTERNRTRLLLASLRLFNSQPKETVLLLNDLEKTYTQMADYILLRRGEALSRIGEQRAAQEAWQQLLQQYPESHASAEALYALRRHDELLRKFPAHPRSRDVLVERLRNVPDLQAALVQAATYFPEHAEIAPLLDRLVASGAQLSPSQWWSVADGYYDYFEFSKAARAYSRATPNSFTVYRTGRSFHRARQNERAITAYRRVVQQFPNSPEAPRALVRITQIATPEQALAAADQIIANYPDTAAEGMFIKAEILQNRLGSAQTASTVRKTLLSQYPNSDAAASLRWQIARGAANSGSLTQGIQQVNALVTDSPSAPIAAEAAFNGGKWAERVGDKARAKALYEFVVQQHPESYFAWRSAGALGLPVGSFTTARNIQLPLNPDSVRSPLPAGSAKVQELYVVGLNRDAYHQWRSELGAKRALPPKELFTDGVLRIGVNDNLKGIAQLDSLSWLDVTPEQKAEVALIKQQPIYWQSLYPIPFSDLISKWSQDRNLPPALVAGLIRQESRFEVRIRSHVGATGLMQIMPETGEWIASKKGVSNYSLTEPQDNISFGTWYLDYTHRRNGDNSMLAIASYNAGPGAVSRWVAARGLGDPDEFVRNIPYAETRDYVEKVFGNYWNYLRLYSPVIKQKLNEQK
jgi:soluble lytic murein transglycosylase